MALREQMDEEKAINGVMAISRKQEHGWWGLGTTGVKSYGDLAANWEGFRFFRNLFDGPNPHFSCQDGKLSVRREFKIKDYVSLSWSESANCSAFADKQTSAKVNANLEARGVTCPVNASDCDQLLKRYEGSSLELQNLVSPVCRQHIKFAESIEPVGKNDAVSIGIVFGGINKNVIRQTIKDLFSSDSDEGTK